MASPPKKCTAWLLVAHNVLHLNDAKAGSDTWWCVTRDAAVGDKCFLYKPLTGIILYFEVLRMIQPQGFCSSYAMATAQVRILKVFKPPLTAKALRSSSKIRKQGFVHLFDENFKGKLFILKRMPKHSIALQEVIDHRRTTAHRDSWKFRTKMGKDRTIPNRTLRSN